MINFRFKHKLTAILTIIGLFSILIIVLYLLNSIQFDPISVERFGAKPNDLFDDAVAIQEAINYASDLNTSVYFPKGIYIISKQIKINSNITIDGQGSTIKTDLKQLFSNDKNVINLKFS